MRHLFLLLLALPLSLAAADPTPYPLTTCIVSGEPLGAMGPPVESVRNGQQLKFCCKACIKNFDKAPGTYLPRLKAAPPAAESPAVYAH